MNPMVKRLLLEPQGIVKRGLVGWYKFDEPAGSQVLIDYSGYGNHGQNGSAVGVDTNDVTFDGQKAVFGLDDYISVTGLNDIPQLSLITAFNAASAGGGSVGRFCSKGSKNFYITSNKLGLLFTRVANSTTYTGDTSVAYGNNAVMFIGMDFNNPDNAPKMYYNMLRQTITKGGAGAGATVSEAADTLILGNRSTPDRNLDGSIYMQLFYNVLLTDAEYIQNYKAIRRLMANRGVVLP